jgi:hypothetical protein
MENKKIMKAVENIELKKNGEFLRTALVSKASSMSRKTGFDLRIIPLAAALLAAAATGLYMKVDYNNTDSKMNDLGGIWSTYDDRGSNGTSVVWPPASTSCENLFVKSSPGYGGKGYAVRITGTTGTKLGYDFIGVNTFLSQYSSCPRCSGIDIKKFTGIEFKVKGKIVSGLVSVIIPHESAQPDKLLFTCRNLTNYEDFEADITKRITPDWKVVRLDFRKDFKQPGWTKKENITDMETVLSNANLLKWQFKGSGGVVDIWIDDLQLY